MIFEPLVFDLKYAVRGLRAKPGFAIAVVSTIALGIGANAAMFGIVDRLLFRPPPLLRDPATARCSLSPDRLSAATMSRTFRLSSAAPSRASPSAEPSRSCGCPWKSIAGYFAALTRWAGVTSVARGW